MITNVPEIRASAEATTAALEARGVSRRFGEHAAVSDVSIRVGSGEFFSLLGPSGCGKTTLLRMLAGFERPDDGTIHVAGVDATSVAPSRRAVNMMFQQYALFPHLSVQENVAFGLRVKRTPRAERERRVREVLDVVELGPVARRRPAQLSGGQQQRVALARALVCEPAALLLDEPLGALDVQLRRQMQDELKRVQTEVGTAFVYVTHDQEEALAMSDRVAVMNAGVVEQIAAPSELYHRPASRFVADFVGQLNPFALGAVDASSGHGRTDLPDGSRVVAVREPGAGGSPGPVSIGVRPERIRLDGRPVLDADRTSLRGVVAERAFLGQTTRVRVDTPLGSVVSVRPESPDAPQVAIGDVVFVTWEPGDALWFDGSSNENGTEGTDVDR